MKSCGNYGITLRISLSLAFFFQCFAFDSDICTKKCVQEYYSSIPKSNGSEISELGGIDSVLTPEPDYNVYSTCMSTCIEDDVKLHFVYDDYSKDECHVDFPGKIEGTADICPPTDVKAEAVRVKTQDGEIVEYLSISWKPCSVGILDLRGFQVVIYLPYVRDSTECLLLKLDKNLDHSDGTDQLTFSAIYPYRLDNNGEKYSFYVVSLPRSRELPDVPVHEYIAKRCADLHADDPCKCGFAGLEMFLKKNPIAIDVSVDGYTLNIVLDELEDCFEIHWIQYQIWTQFNDSANRPANLHLEERETFRDFRMDARRSADQPPDGRVHYQFKSMYNLKPNISYFLRIQACSSQVEPRNIVNKIPFQVTQWPPTLPEVEVSEKEGRGSALVTYEEASAGFNIEKYILRLVKVDGYKTVLIANETISQSKDGKGFGSHVFSELKGGTYKVQVREYREEHDEASLGAVLSDTVWGPQQQFIIVVDNSYAMLLTAVIIVCVMALFVLGAVVCVHYRRRDALFMEKCKPVTADSYSSPKVWLIWQADERSIELQESHCENIRHFAAYLHTMCGFNIILDMFEKPEVHLGSYKWIQKANKRADVIIFVCPHYDPQSPDEKTEANIYCEIGNFDASFRYLQSELTSHSRSNKFYTVTLPYSELRMNDTTNWLRRTSPVFHIEHGINDLYCTLRGGDSMVCCTKLFIPRIDTKNSSDWADLQTKLARFAALQKRYLDPNNDKESISSSSSLVVNNDEKDSKNDKTSLPSDADSSQKLIPIISNNTIMNIEPPLPLDTYEETIELLDATSSSSSSL